MENRIARGEIAPGNTDQHKNRVTNIGGTSRGFTFAYSMRNLPSCERSAWNIALEYACEVDRSNETVCFPCRGCERGSGGSREKLLRVGSGGK